MVRVEKLGVFLSSISAFFAQIDNTQVDVDTPYLNNNKSVVGYDYSGMIKISGPLAGCVYVSAPSIMLREIIKVMGEPDSSITMMKDLLGEIANTISGNARTELGRILSFRHRRFLTVFPVAPIYQKTATALSHPLVGAVTKP